ncbi:MAG: FAD:protein FMN transferase [Candidatus Anammoximicrobium sp.]|nr:FAD:protein FMN transferase [Candidatus Anammoximicrobium sp.]
MFTSLFLTVALAAVCADEHLERYRESRPGMGSTFEIIAYAPDKQTAKRGMDAAFARIEQLNQVFSDYESDSEACRLSHAAPMPQAVPVSAEMCAVLDYSIQLSRQTDGAFDVTVGPVSRLWRRARRQRQLPAPERLRETLASVGYRHLELDAAGRKARLAAAGMRLDFGAVAVGFAVDEALAVLKLHGLTRVLVNGSGDLALGEAPPGETGWRIGVAPLEPNQPPSRFLRLAHCGVSTSGDAWQYVEIDGCRYSHIVDPRTGIGLTQRSSVTVIAPNGMAADGLATAASVLGAEKGLALIERTCGAACLMVLVEDDKPRLHKSRDWKKHEVGGSLPPN